MRSLRYRLFQRPENNDDFLAASRLRAPETVCVTPFVVEIVRESCTRLVFSARFVWQFGSEKTEIVERYGSADLGGSTKRIEQRRREADERYRARLRALQAAGISAKAAKSLFKHDRATASQGTSIVPPSDFCYI